MLRFPKTRILQNFMVDHHNPNSSIGHRLTRPFVERNASFCPWDIQFISNYGWRFLQKMSLIQSALSGSMRNSPGHRAGTTLEHEDFQRSSWRLLFGGQTTIKKGPRQLHRSLYILYVIDRHRTFGSTTIEPQSELVFHGVYTVPAFPKGNIETAEASSTFFLG